MKIWKEFNSSHSNNITIVGEFSSPADLEKAFAMIEDFTLGSWEERYPSVEEFKEHWAINFHSDMKYSGITNEEYMTGIDNAPDISKDSGTVTISSFRNDNLGGLIKVLRRAGARKITIEE